MKAELVFAGRHLRLYSRSRRRKLVVLIYVLLFAFILAMWLVTRVWPSWTALTWNVLVFVVVILNSSILGGFYRRGRGLIKPFTGNETLQSFGIDVSTLERDSSSERYLREIYENDERDLRRRNEVHWRAYRYLYPAIAIPCLLALLKKPIIDLRLSSVSTIDTLLWCAYLTSLCVYVTLPQAILLWTEPDMDPTD